MSKFKDYYLFSDIDGTLMTDQYEIPKNNLEAISYYLSEGGNLALATGRGLNISRSIVEDVKPNMPCILSNGGVIYDFKTEELMFAAYLKEPMLQVIYRLLAERPDLQGFVWNEHGRFDISEKTENKKEELTKYLDEIERPWLKMVFRVPPEERLKLVAKIENYAIEDITVVSSCDWLIEIHPKGVSKGHAVLWLLDKMKINHDAKILVAGDYENDAEMLSLPGVRSFCPDNAPDEIKMLCTDHLCHVNDGAIAQLISRL